MIGKTEIRLGDKVVDLDFNIYAYEQLGILLAKYADKGLNIDLSPETFQNLFDDVQRTSFLLASRMVIYSGVCGFYMHEGLKPKYSYGDIRDMVNNGSEEDLMQVINFFLATTDHPQEGEEKEKVEHTHVSKKKVSHTKKSKKSASGQSE